MVNTDKKQEIKIIPLGGLGEIGKNMYVIEDDKEIVIIDSGIKFPDSELFGIDYIIPNYSYLVENAHKIKGLFITHGHEDHIGGIPFLLKELQIPIYAGKLALGFIRSKLEEHRLLREATLYEITEEDTITFSSMEVSFFRTTHSIPDSFGIVVNTSMGNVVHTGDFKFDFTPIGPAPDLIRMGEIGRNGVLCLLSDSTNSEVPGISLSEKHIGNTIIDVVKKQEGRIIFATFASNVYRLQQVINASVLTNRKVFIAGRSMERAITLGRELGYIDAPDSTFISEFELRSLPSHEVTILCTGSQGEPFAALSRIASGRHRHIHIIPGDTVVFSSSPIPGNGLSVNRVINLLARAGADVIHHKLNDIHTSGHGAQEELKLMITLMKPKFFVPIHGEFRMQKMHRTLAIQCGVPEQNTYIIDNGDVLSITEGNDVAAVTGKVPANPVYIDGHGVGDIGRSVLNERKILAEHGMISVFLLRKDKVAFGKPQIISRGFVYVRQSEQLMDDIQTLVTSLVQAPLGKFELEKKIREALSGFIYEQIKRNPLIITRIIDLK
ncbi:ribonuclease J [Litchfieldia salsa]|uniref:Ribonuclease J n=1 Tax=Litchfieldia salsa TaxID=930152 RepID=A0A1H0WTA6_9BACI|nr:ribonuclease J [Litchfieldia salsa]SDP93943.1 ribonuclease J [Litchfieldia salsa]